jgi:hypothetical protein
MEKTGGFDCWYCESLESPADKQMESKTLEETPSLEIPSDAGFERVS